MRFINEKEYTSNRTGKLTYNIELDISCFEPNPLPLEITINHKLLKLVGDTIAELGRLNGKTDDITPQEIRLLKIPFFLKEAQLSSEIEGTHSTLDDVYKGKKDIDLDEIKKLDNEEINNYQDALSKGLDLLEDKELDEKIIKDLHSILLNGVRGKDKESGDFKTEQNAIGSRFIPASPQTTPYLIQNLIDYTNNDKEIYNLLKIAIIHYQFESIHPFRDGNGRIGRLLIILLLIQKKILSQPLIYISEYFNTHRSIYVDLLYYSSTKGEIENWIEFFLLALKVQAQKAIRLINALDEYKKSISKKISKVHNSLKYQRMIELLFSNPYVEVRDVENDLGISYPTANKIVNNFVKEGILTQWNLQRRHRIFVCREIIEILQSR